MVGKFFHTPNARRFNMTCRYYDQEKEEMNNREDRIKSELGLNKNKEFNPNYRPNIRGQFRNSMGMNSKSASDARKRSNTRLIFLIIVLSLAFFLILKF